MSQAELDRRECQAISVRAARVAARVDDLRARAGLLAAEQATLPVPGRPSGQDVAGWRDYERRLLGNQAALESAIVRRRDEVVAASLRDQLTAVRVDLDLDLSGLDAGRDRAGAAAEARDVGPGDDPEHRRRASVSAMSHLLARVQDARTRQLFAERAATALATGGARGVGLVRALQADVQRTVRAQEREAGLAERRRRVADAAAELPADLASALTFTDQLDDARVDALERALDDARAEHRRRLDEVFVRRQTRDLLESLGYEIHDEGERFLATADRLSGEHALQLRFLPGRGRFITSVVALAESSPAADTAAETETCADVEQVSRLLRDRGVRASRDHHRAPGTVPVERVAVPAVESARRRRASRERNA